MAEVTAMRNNALPYPVYGLPWTLVVPILDADGDPVPGAAGLDAEVSKNGDTPADCVNAEVEVGNGDYAVSLTASEMAADVVAFTLKTSTSGAKATKAVLYPRKLPMVRSGVAQGGAAGTITLDAGAPAVDGCFSGCVVYLASGTGYGQARLVTGYTGSTRQAAVTAAWSTPPDSSSTFQLSLPEGRVVSQADVAAWAAAAVAAPDAAGCPKVTLKSGTGTGELALAGGVADANVAKCGGSPVAAGALPNAPAGQNGGLPTVNAANRVAGIQGTLATLDALADSVKGSPAGRTVKEAYEKADAAQAVTDKLDAMLEADGADWRFDANALERVPGAADWSEGERQQIRTALGLTGIAAPTTGSGHVDAMLGKVTTLVGQPLIAPGAVAGTGQDVARYRGDTVPIAFELGRDITGASLRFTVKRRATDPQSAALIAKSSGSGSQIVITDPATGKFAVKLLAADTASLLPDGRRAAFLYDVEMTLGGAVETVAAGAFVLLPDVTTP